MMQYKEKYSIGVDYISFTSHTMKLIDLARLLGLSHRDLFRLDYGMHGYDVVYKIKDVNAFLLEHSKRDDMGVHFTVSGSGIDTLFMYWVEAQAKETETPFGKVEYSVVDFVLDLYKYGRFTRLDIAFDDFEINNSKPAYTPKSLWNYHKQGRIVSKFHTFKFIGEDSSKAETGSTFYCGSRKSGCMLRVYDKKLEQNKKLLAGGKELLTDEWVRWEMELHDEHANNFILALNDMFNCAEYEVFPRCFLCKHFQAVLNGMFRIINLDDSNRTRCSTTKKWIQFVKTISQVSISVHVAESSLSKKLDWVNRSVKPTLISLFVGHGYSFNWLFDNMESTYERMSDKLISALKSIDKEFLRTLCMIEDSVLIPKPLFSVGGIR